MASANLPPKTFYSYGDHFLLFSFFGMLLVWIVLAPQSYVCLLRFFLVILKLHGIA